MIDIADFKPFCQELVEAVSKLLGNRTINIMDMDGIIIASTEKHRIGTLHTGARHVAVSGHDLAITEDILPNYPGAKVGYNMPLTYKGHMIGVIGMFGIPDEVRDMAQLLRIYADKYFELEGSMEAKLVDLSLRAKLFGLLATETGDMKNIGRVMEMLDVSFIFPVRLIRISRTGNVHGPDPMSFEKIAEALCEASYLDPRHDFWSSESDSLTVINSKGSAESISSAAILSDFRVIITESVPDYPAISHAYDEALWIERSMDDRVIDLGDPEDRMRFLLFRMSESSCDMTDVFISRLKASITDNEMRKFIESVLLYYESGMSVMKASETLGIHKNTLQTRVKRVIEAAGIGEYPHTERYFILYLVWIRLFGSMKTLSSTDKLGLNGRLS